ncbi:prevent-host-death family protein [Desulfonatronospira thiodismutans ASO3-1]|uniref:Antitoxin n=1 Tax=Desulfonatronospira thiodismutans ASO3-1 TaxID=555779 RepID=D6STR0_9BACT|nr:type II toxin-antitoxin system Phd/YefM family antitoxin [Desulfonatronospira thiodismutans]EFI34076.1 prevent-host-death family protein [Desulfonatronospira thiodismutans ASO3-1]
MDTINVHEAKTHLSRLIQKVLQGEEVIIAKKGRPLVRMVPFDQSRQKRVPGLSKGSIKMRENFDEPLPDDIIRAFEA